MSDDITQLLRVTMPTFEGLEISCPCAVRSALMEEAAAEIEQLTRERNEARAEVERLRKEMREIAEDCESEYPSSYKKIAWFIRNALEAKP